MVNNIAIFGAGGLGKEVACLINKINEVEPTWNLIGFFDDNPSVQGTNISHFGPCLGGIDVLNAYPNSISVVLAVGSSLVVKKIFDKITNPNINFPNIIHPDFKIADAESFKIGYGNIIQSDCRVTCDISIGNFNLLNGSVVFGHSASIGDFNTFMPECRLSGEVSIGNYNFFGVASIVIQRIKIGNHVRLGAGSVLMTKPKEGVLYLGVPARKTEF